MNVSFYEQNLQALAKVNIKLATRLFGLGTNNKFEVFVDEKDPINVNLAESKSRKVVYEGIPIRQTEKMLKQFLDTHQRYPFLYFFGMGNGIFYKALLGNAIIQRMVIVEPELEILYIALHFNDFAKEIDAGRLLLFCADEIDFAKAVMIFMHPEARIFAKTYALRILVPFYEQNYIEEVVRIDTLFVKAIEHVVRSIGNDSIDALIGLKHHIANVEKMVGTPTLTELMERAKNSQTAVIVSTGPSLKKQLPLLKKVQESVTIFCVDASFPILEQWDIKPDVVFSIERVIETAKFYTNVSKDFQKDIIFAITSIAHPDLFGEIKAGTLQMSMRPFGYTQYFDKKEYGYLGIGMSAANMAYELMFHADFQTCILIGQDLAFGANGETHSDGHIYGSQERDRLKGKVLHVPAYGGNGVVRTTQIWQLFKNFFETDIAYANDRGIVTVNATEGGARIEGSVEMSFAQSIEKYVDLQYKKEKIDLSVRDAVTVAEDMAAVQDKVTKMLSYAQSVQKEVENLFLEVAKECEIIEKVDEKLRYEQLDFQRLADLMEKIDTIKEYFAQQEFADIFIDATQAVIVNQEIAIATIQVRDVKTDNEKRQKMIDWVMAHRYWFFSLAGIMQATVDSIKMGMEMQLEFRVIECVSVVLGKKEIDTIAVDHSNVFINNLADIKGLCVQYVLDKKHTKNADKLEFYYTDKKDSFKTEVFLPTRSDPNFMRFCFVNSLEETLDRRRFKKSAKKATEPFYIGLLEVKNAEENQKFIETVQKICKEFEEVQLKFLCWKEDEKNMMRALFFKELDKIDFIAPKNIYELYDEIDMFIYDFEKLDDSRLYAVQSILNSTQEIDVPQLRIQKFGEEEITPQIQLNALKLALSIKYMQRLRIDVYIKDEKIDEIISDDGSMIKNIADIKQLCFNYEPDTKYSEKLGDLRFIYNDLLRNMEVEVYLPKRSSERYSEYKFENSLNITVDQKLFEIKEQESVIGFLMTKESLEDRGFTDYIKELIHAIPNIQLKVFYLSFEKEYDEIEGLEAVKVSSISDIALKADILIVNDKETVCKKIVHNVFFKNLFILPFNTGVMSQYVKENQNEHLVKIMKDNSDKFGIARSEIETFDNHILINEYIRLKKSGHIDMFSSEDILEKDFRQMYLDMILLAFEDRKYFKLLCEQREIIYALLK
jgi:hypothetical protein